ncbi:DUF551 domain-containing protein [Enterobacter hormaechei]|uniref:DUF551 domain-containing protein n=1 Tax=Enterobacter hormaechei TaxID=158836 RepID=UPI0027387258|nr:DUF551 domain-containing protein [Enterobacter hormaechei]MDZ5681659.1 DUF551 domain-containing protein [Enterobacter hormaechei]WLP13242.1 DUF551 domain-containing protein [Enterobacter hormaechei]HCD9772871.1 DUF551 domain-containing protein [Enterobacter hormaechei]HCE3973762.1 DUF551 domain-containing protein [Enterobacter hormaechei]
MSELTKEWLLKTIAELEEEREAVPGIVNEDAAMALAAMKLALASLEAEPVAFRSKLKPPSAIGSENWGYTDHRQPDAFELESCVIERLYTAPPAPFVPDEINVLQAANLVLTLGVLDNGIPTVAMKVWNACRAAMLQGADGKSQVIPDGWVACSERMPEESGRYWCYVEEQNDLGKSHYQWNCSWNGDRWWVESENGCRVTHWQPLPSPPAK